MRIALRPSGGRGDYELAGSFNQLRVSDLLEKNFIFQLIPGHQIDGHVSAHRLSGKPRIRPVEGGVQPYLLIYSALLMPPPIRELKRTPNSFPRLFKDSYTLAGIDVDVISISRSSVTLAPKKVWARSQGGWLGLDYDLRMAAILSLWAAAEIKKSRISKLILEHRAAVSDGKIDEIIRIAAAIQEDMGTSEDTLRILLEEFGLPPIHSAAYQSPQQDDTLDPTDQTDYTSLKEAQRERVFKWRLQADRGPAAREFSVEVKKAYDHRCVFSGERFPKLENLSSGGTDGAHILPWSTHNLNTIPNGLCLCKLCHWAFDSGVLKLSFDRTANIYLLSIPKEVERSAVAKRFDIVHFKKFTGPINTELLPTRKAFWPSPECIEELERMISV